MHLTSYERVDPVIAKAPFPLYPGATPLVAQTELSRRARLLSGSGEAAKRKREGLFEIDAPLAAVEAYYAGELGSNSDAPPSITRSTGDFAADDVALSPLLTKLNLPHSRGVATGRYQAVVITGEAGRPTVSLQRPYRDFALDRIVDRTSILISE